MHKNCSKSVIFGATMPKQTYFDEKWMKDGHFDWLDGCDHNDRTAFKCLLCCKVLKLSRH